VTLPIFRNDHFGHECLVGGDESVAFAGCVSLASAVSRQPLAGVFTTSVTQAEILFGVELLPKGKRRAELEGAVETTFEEDFVGRILPFDNDAARLYSVIAATRRKLGRPMGALDAQIAAIATSRGAIVATRNTADFDHCGVTVVNPWSARS
jgi:predicted nucleic acid-binding protein